jgi:hypothetical protein
MRRSSAACRTTAGHAQIRRLGRSSFVITFWVSLWIWTPAALALPSFAVQTGQPCAACHVGAWGPQLKKAGRDFKLFGYSAEDQSHDFPPVALLVNGGFTHTEADQPGGAGPHLANGHPINNLSELLPWNWKVGPAKLAARTSILIVARHSLTVFTDAGIDNLANSFST